MTTACNDGPFVFKAEFFYSNGEYTARAAWDFPAGTIPTPEMVEKAHAEVDELMKTHVVYRRLNRHETMVEHSPHLQGFALPGPEHFPNTPKKETET